MAVVRELVTRLGFSFDRSNLDKFERSIVGFKTQTAIAVGLIGTAFKKVIDYANEFSDKVLKNSALAKFAKTSANELEALQNVFQKFNIPTETFQSFFGKLSIGIKEASRGVNNDFRKLVRESQGAVRLFVNGQLTTTKQAIDDIFNYIKNISDESEQLRIVENIFKVDIATADAIVNLANITKNEFDGLIEKEKRSVEELNNAKKAALNFKNEINSLNVEWTKFFNSVASFSLPYITQVFKGANLLTEDLKNGVISKKINETFIEADRRALNLENERIYNMHNETTGMTNNISFEFNVPPGTNEESANYFSESVISTLSNFFDIKVREVMNNNPQVE